MRVVAGTLGGRALAAPRGMTVRPTSDRVREAVFAVLGPLDAELVVDLYCGTGAMAIEALSRGAGRAVLVDRDTRAALGNVRNLGVDDRADLVRARLPAWLRSRAAGELAGRAELVFCDPPYRLDPSIGAQLDQQIPPLLHRGGRLILESSARRPLRLASLELLNERVYGGTHIAFYGGPDAG